ncbi:hypothetical protein IscW_ISCW007847 [Ixodes scapularis]|uniref:Uncharacterized protein n=1 Tax=Ixodes scapularis TaxID=6945 RepID=B7PWE3_IXOSC|nr:hypothetical protein IscW_ISCW007847 [Ixodes scapularis]|eukprot:XP_002409705.1 hypothetical protein IscW_ISCW007847 [Ixodes scapularis]
MEEIVDAWGSFIRAGRPSIPLPGFDWPLYTTESPQLLYLRPSNYTKGYFPRRKTCELWRPFLFRSEPGKSQLPQPSKPTKEQKTDIINHLTTEDRTAGSSALQIETFLPFVLFVSYLASAVL